jgi:UDP-N-acetylglucosamine--N-acetylmuramyl-(pentapeptide) pyrophosphoryl-undecaprenol N-acetylglucosamine transferase
MTLPSSSPAIAIACGGTGGHFFPGLAVADRLLKRGCSVGLFISTKEVDQKALALTRGMEVEITALPAVGLTRGRVIAFARGWLRSWRASKTICSARRYHAALAMGGFTSAPPILAARRFGARTFLHESNTIPGRANRWLSRIVNQAFVGFPQAASRLHVRNVTVTGTPVRPQFVPPRDGGAASRERLGLDPARPVLLVMGGSQGAAGINDLVLKALPLLARALPQLQLVHLTGPNHAEQVRQACASLQLKAVVHSFFAEMELALGAATVAISRAGASSLAELAAMRVPSLLIPYPAATDNHQFHNARAFEETGAARILDQKTATAQMLAGSTIELLERDADRAKMQNALAGWDRPNAADQIAESILAAIVRNADSPVRAGNAEAGAREPGGSRPETIERKNFSIA